MMKNKCDIAESCDDEYYHIIIKRENAIINTH